MVESEIMLGTLCQDMRVYVSPCPFLNILPAIHAHRRTPWCSLSPHVMLPRERIWQFASSCILFDSHGSNISHSKRSALWCRLWSLMGLVQALQLTLRAQFWDTDKVEKDLVTC